MEFHNADLVNGLLLLISASEQVDREETTTGGVKKAASSPPSPSPQPFTDSWGVEEEAAGMLEELEEEEDVFVDAGGRVEAGGGGGGDDDDEWSPGMAVTGSTKPRPRSRSRSNSMSKAKAAAARRERLNSVSTVRSEPARATGRLSDARRAEQYLSFVRDTVGPTREDFRALVAGIHDTKRSSSADAVHGMKRFDARPKYVLRKLAFSVVPSTPAERVDFIRNRLGLDKSVPTEQRLCTKRDAFDILSAVCDHAPEYAQIPEVLRCR